MNFLNSVKYRYSRILKSNLIIYAAVILLLGIMIWANAIYHNKDFCESGVVFCAMVLVAFICGIRSFNTDFDFLIQNGVSRDTIHFSFVATLPICFVLSLTERLVSLVAAKVLKADLVSFMTFCTNCNDSDLKISIPLELVLQTLIFMMVMCLGYFIIMFFKRVKLTYIILTVIVILFGVAVEMVLYHSKNLIFPTYFITLNAFFVGATCEEIMINHFIFSSVFVIAILLSLSHIMILTLGMNKRRKVK